MIVKFSRYLKKTQNITDTNISAGQLDMKVSDHEAGMKQGTYRLIQPLNQTGWTTWYSVYSPAAISADSVSVVSVIRGSPRSKKIGKLKK
jgi:hypothetical protein